MKFDQLVQKWGLLEEGQAITKYDPTGRYQVLDQQFYTKLQAAIQGLVNSNNQNLAPLIVNLQMLLKQATATGFLDFNGVAKVRTKDPQKQLAIGTQMWRYLFKPTQNGGVGFTNKEVNYEPQAPVAAKPGMKPTGSGRPIVRPGGQQQAPKTKPLSQKIKAGAGKVDDAQKEILQALHGGQPTIQA